MALADAQATHAIEAMWGLASGNYFGVIVTDGNYSNFHLDFEYAWGPKKLDPRKEMLRDAGLIYHIADSNKRTWGIWPVSMECQIQEGDTADDRWQHRHGSPGHGRSHVMPALVPPYATVPVVDGRLLLGTWQSICLVDLNVDNAVREVRFSFLAG